MDSRGLCLLLGTTIALGSLTACGGPDDPIYQPQILPWAYRYTGPGKFDGKSGEVFFPGTPSPVNETGPDLPPEERAKYCAVHVEPEPDSEVKNKFLADLSAAWKREASYGPFEQPFGLTFSFSASQGRASLSGALFESDETITFDSVFVSKPVADGRYKDYRIVELPADNNAGAAVFAAAFMPGAKGRNNPALFLTARKYWRFGQTDRIRTTDAVFARDKDGESSVRLWIYPIKN